MQRAGGGFIGGAATCCRGCGRGLGGGLEDSRGAKGGRKKTEEEDGSPKFFTMRVERTRDAGGLYSKGFAFLSGSGRPWVCFFCKIGLIGYFG
jgi:hypothetical protein